GTDDDRAADEGQTNAGEGQVGRSDHNEISLVIERPSSRRTQDHREQWERAQAEQYSQWPPTTFGDQCGQAGDSQGRNDDEGEPPGQSRYIQAHAVDDRRPAEDLERRHDAHPSLVYQEDLLGEPDPGHVDNGDHREGPEVPGWWSGSFVGLKCPEVPLTLT